MRIEFEIVVTETKGISTKTVHLSNNGSSGEIVFFETANELKKIVADYIKDTYLETKNNKEIDL